ncbi:MarC family protein [Paraburkholderia sp. BL10I2N1]|uniref:MarC family protein n=1 Tax=Paraburkholderia sp. BL10I2N1 TaxID=1938796 RepID=UPI0010612E63|nr:MarC family protein [Paraburkholderia sp. BL10I2N1]TDN57802.1 multiple antibiotic resistance protein [Paraburkholderia sp. BL10I2N1]
MLNQLADTILLVVAGLFPVVNPPAAGFIVLSLVPHATPEERAYLARAISINSLIILLVSLVIGAYVLSFFGISIPVLRVAGGLVIAFAGWTLLNKPADADRGAEHRAVSDAARKATLQAKAFYPLTLPVTVGPGSIAVAIALGTGRPRAGISLVNVIGVAIAMVLLCGSIYVCVRFAVNVQRLLGPIGTLVAMRLFAFVLFCIGIQIIWLGLDDLLESVRLTVQFS